MHNNLYNLRVSKHHKYQIVSDNDSDKDDTNTECLICDLWKNSKGKERLIQCDNCGARMHEDYTNYCGSSSKGFIAIF